MINSIVIDNFTIVSGIALLAIGLLSPLFSPFVRFRRSRAENGIDEVGEGTDGVVETSASSLLPLSVILTPHDEADKLACNLPHILNQNYPAGFQVIVVIEEGDHETEDLIKRLRLELDDKDGDASLYMTYIPRSSRYMSRKKLAMTLGMKAARTDWVLFTEAYTKPASDNWLLTMAENCTEDKNLVIGYGCYADDMSSSKQFERFYTSCYLMREDSRGIAYRTQSHNIMLRNSDFMQQEGFRGNLEYLRGEYDFLVNKYATDGSTALETRHDAWMVDDVPSHKSWLNKNIFYMETRKALQRSGKHRLWFNMDQTVMHLCFWLSLASVAYGALCNNVIVLAAGAVSLVLTFVIRTTFGYKALKSFKVRVPAMLVYPLEMSMMWRNLGWIIRHRLADKLDFTTHKQ